MLRLCVLAARARVSIVSESRLASSTAYNNGGQCARRRACDQMTCCSFADISSSLHASQHVQQGLGTMGLVNESSSITLAARYCDGHRMSAARDSRHAGKTIPVADRSPRTPDGFRDAGDVPLVHKLEGVRRPLSSRGQPVTIKWADPCQTHAGGIYVLQPPVCASAVGFDPSSPHALRHALLHSCS